MILQNALRIEIGRLLAILIFAAFLGLFFGHTKLIILIALSVYLFWHAYYLWVLARWLSKDKKYTPPVAYGIWGAIFDEIYRLLRRQRQRNKRFSEWLHRFRESTNAMPDAVVVLQENGEIEWWNSIASEWLPLRYPQDVGQRITNLIRLPEFSTFWNEGHEGDAVEIRGPVNLQQHLRVRLIPYGNQQKLLVLRDVTVFFTVENMRRDFIANISHELRTPLTVLSGYLENMTIDSGQEKPIDPGMLNMSVQRMQQQVLRMSRLVEDLLVLSRLESPGTNKKEDLVEVPQLLAALQDEAQILSQGRHQIMSEIDNSLRIYGTTSELDSLFRNLVINAINYTPSGGAIRIRWYLDGEQPCFEVHDTGVGIARHHIPRLTERFYRIDVARSRETGGSGLGLAIVKHVLQRHKGTLDVDSEVGRGSTFRCLFPKELAVQRES